jgi:hypothetical protein
MEYVSLPLFSPPKMLNVDHISFSGVWEDYLKVSIPTNATDFPSTDAVKLSYYRTYEGALRET